MILYGLITLEIQGALRLLSRPLGRFAPIFYFNCEHVLIVNIKKQRRKKFCGIYKKKFADFQDLKNLIFLQKYKLLYTNFFNLMFSRFDVYWMQTDRQSNKQTYKQIYV